MSSMYLSVNSTFAVVAYFAGFIQFIVAFSTTQWVGLENHKFESLWKTCRWFGVEQEWRCHDVNPNGYVQVSQAFAVMALMCFIASFVLVIPFVISISLQKSRGVLLALVFLTFIAGCMTVMSAIVMGVKGEHVLSYYAIEQDLPVGFIVGWSYVVAITAAVFTFIAFVIFTMEFLRIASISEITNV